MCPGSLRAKSLHTLVEARETENDAPRPNLAMITKIHNLYNLQCQPIHAYRSISPFHASPHAHSKPMPFGTRRLPCMVWVCLGHASALATALGMLGTCANKPGQPSHATEYAMGRGQKPPSALKADAIRPVPDGCRAWFWVCLGHAVAPIAIGARSTPVCTTQT